jgi:hypothetical protein
MEGVGGKRDLLDIVFALGPGSGFSNLLDSGHQQGNQNADDCNNN